jgi:hypothetical protein
MHFSQSRVITFKRASFIFQRKRMKTKNSILMARVRLLLSYSTHCIIFWIVKTKALEFLECFSFTLLFCYLLQLFFKYPNVLLPPNFFFIYSISILNYLSRYFTSKLNFQMIMFERSYLNYCHLLFEKWAIIRIIGKYSSLSCLLDNSNPCPTIQKKQTQSN